MIKPSTSEGVVERADPQKVKRDEKSFKSAIASSIYIKQQNAEAKKRKLFAYILPRLFGPVWW